MGPPPPVLTRFLLERRFWQELGVSRGELLSRPWQEVEDYLLILSLRDQLAAQRAAGS